MVCLVRENPAMPAPTVEPAEITLNGDYANRVCGTGGVETTAGVIDFINPLVDDVTGLSIRIDFIAGQGVMVVAGNAGGHPVAGDGTVQIRPVVGNCVTTDVEQWAVDGAFELTGP